ncbi:hypothetical protein V7S43_012005 [Phytophthora oleae]|uniref:HTH CENPB-type domain-containing protein n=1 Tax=Phytophthora oleae TaxID=2107226 RepID=A0ABD3FAS1_9STRA
MIIEKCETGCGSHSRGRSPGMGTTLFPQFEEQLVQWINSLRQEGIPVTATMVRIHANDCYVSTGLLPINLRLRTPGCWLSSDATSSRLGGARGRDRRYQRTLQPKPMPLA